VTVIVDCAAYRDGMRVAADPLSLDEIPSNLSAGDGFVWLGLRMPDASEMRRAADALGLTDLDCDAAVAPHDRPVLTRAGNATWLVLRTSEYNDKLEQVMLGELSVIFTDRFVLTVRYGQASPLDGVRRELEAEPDELRQGTAFVVAAIVRRVVDDYRPTLDGFERDVLEAEHQVFADTRRKPVERLYRLKRQVLDLLVVIDALYDPLARITRAERLMKTPDVRGELQLATDELGRIVTRTRTLSDLITTAIDANLAQVSLQQNEDMRRISAWVAIAAIPTMIAGIYGMNFKEFPELEWDLGYPAVLLVMFSACGLLYRAFRRSGWL
jgi:magnesium transporter